MEYACFKLQNIKIKMSEGTKEGGKLICVCFLFV